MYKPKPGAIPDGWPTTRDAMQEFYLHLDTWSRRGMPPFTEAEEHAADHVERVLGEMFDDTAYYQFVVDNKTGRLRVYQMVDPRFTLGASDLVAHLHDDAYSGDWATLRTALWAKWCEWVCPRNNQSAAVSAS